MNKKLIALCRYGLANRLRFLSDMHAFSLLTKDCDLQVLWETEPGCGALFEDLFMNKLSQVHRDEISYESADSYNYMWREIDHISPPVNPFTEQDIIIESGYPLTLKAPTRWNPWTKLRLEWLRYKLQKQRYSFLRSLIIRDEILQTIEKYHVQSTIGLHIRVFDQSSNSADFESDKEFFEKSTLALFEQELRQRLEENPQQKFFLSTNSSKIEEEIMKKFDRHMLFYPKRSHERTETTAIQDALIDLRLLSQTQEIIGTLWSSFSSLASKWGEIPLHFVVDPDT